MKGIEINWSSLKDTKPHEYAVQFLFGGFATVVAGLIARKYGRGIGGLFLAFPAIFPASATLIESREKKRKAAIPLRSGLIPLTSPSGSVRSSRRSRTWRRVAGPTFHSIRRP
jgi:hypothetical protein